jgi:hypothetical protein
LSFFVRSALPSDPPQSKSSRRSGSVFQQRRLRSGGCSSAASAAISASLRAHLQRDERGHMQDTMDTLR